MNYDMIERALTAIFVTILGFLGILFFAGLAAAFIEIHNRFDPAYAKKVEEEKHYIAKCKSVDGVFITTNDIRYCYKDGKVIEIE